MIHAREGVLQSGGGMRTPFTSCGKHDSLLLMVESWDFIAIWAAEFPGKFHRPELCAECERSLKLTLRRSRIHSCLVTRSLLT